MKKKDFLDIVDFAMKYFNFSEEVAVLWAIKNGVKMNRQYHKIVDIIFDSEDPFIDLQKVGLTKEKAREAIDIFAEHIASMKKKI